MSTISEVPKGRKVTAMGYLMKIIKWIDEYQGFVLCLLTMIYVYATIKILSANKKSAQAANAQIIEMAQQRKETDIANRQQIALQLIDKRTHSRFILNKWIQIARILEDPPPPDGATTHDLFRAMMFNNFADSELIPYNEEMRSLVELSTGNTLSPSQKQQVDHRIAQLNQKIVMTKMTLLDRESLAIEQIEVLFNDVDWTDLAAFKTAFLDAAMMDPEKLETLRGCTNKIISSGIEQKLLEKTKHEIWLEN